MTTKPKVIAIIPARYDSTRFEGKPLAKIHGRPMIELVYKNVMKCELLDEVIIATDDKRIYDAVLGFGGKVEMTDTKHPVGTDRCAEVAERSDADIIVNIQGDEPLVQPKMIEDLVKPLLDDESIEVTNLISKIDDIGDYVDNTVCKATLDLNGFLLYLSRSPIPYPRSRNDYIVYKHIGIYAFRRDFLLRYVKMKQTPMELIEGIEFLRIIENRLLVKAVEIEDHLISVDTMSDLIEVEKILSKQALE